MDRATSFFFSKILKKDIYDVSGELIGKLNDLILDFNQEKPTARYVQIKNAQKSFYVPIEKFDILKDEKEKYNIKINTKSLLIDIPDDGGIFLAMDFLDKQIVDINGKRVERVNDVRLGNINGKWQLIAVDIGTRGLLRRLGVEYPFILITGALNLQLRNKLIIWDNVQPLTTGSNNLQLYSPASKISTLHAADIADIIEELDNNSRHILFNSLNNQKAAEVFEEIETEIQVNLINSMSDKKASDIFEIMPSDEVADILEEMEDDRVEKLLTQMDEESQEEIRELMEYESDTVGSIMSKDFITFLPDKTVKEVIDWMQGNNPDDEEAYYIYVTNNRNNLLGVVPVLRLITSNVDMKLYNIMTTNPNTLKDEDTIDDAVEAMEKYSLIALPVVDDQNELVGTISLNDSVKEYIPTRRVAL